MGYALIGFIGFGIGMFLGAMIGGALVIIGSKEDEIPWNKEWDK